MRKIICSFLCIALLQACNPSNNNPGEGGTVNDGFSGAGDANGGLSDTSNLVTDTAGKELQRVDLEKRDSSNKP